MFLIRLILCSFLLMGASISSAVTIKITGASKFIFTIPQPWSLQFIHRFLRFTVNGHTNYVINGNHPDNRISHFFQNDPQIDFAVTARDGSVRHLTPSRPFQFHFRQCVLNGMCSSTQINLKPEQAVIPPGTRTLKDLGMTSVLPTSFQFTSFLTNGATEFPDLNGCYSYQGSDSSSDYDEFSVLALFGGDQLIHEMIHLTDGIGLSKLGSAGIYFHTVEDIIRFYQLHSSVPLQVAICKYHRHDKFDPPPPPPSGSSAVR